MLNLLNPSWDICWEWLWLVSCVTSRLTETVGRGDLLVLEFQIGWKTSKQKCECEQVQAIRRWRRMCFQLPPTEVQSHLLPTFSRGSHSVRLFIFCPQVENILALFASRTKINIFWSNHANTQTHSWNWKRDQVGFNSPSKWEFAI